MTTPDTTTGSLGLGWAEEAACASVPELPWIGPRRGQPLDPDQLEQMIQTCDHCPVLDQCRRYVQEADVTAGFWAGAWQHPSQHVNVDDYPDGRVA